VSTNPSLRELFREIMIINDLPSLEISLTGIKIDSRLVSKGDLYLAVVGTQVDGHSYIEDAVSRGAAAVVGSEPASSYKGLGSPYLQVEDTRLALAELAAAWFDFPARKMIIIGVTGTDGKTTTANLIYQILLAAGIKAGLISTVNAIIGDKVLDTGFHVTTPEAMDLQFYLSEMVKENITHVVLEATSHGLAQKRVATCEFDIGAVTNITHEHLDYHGDYQAYFVAKAELFRLIEKTSKKPGSYNNISVLNLDDRSYSELSLIVSETGIPEVKYGIDPRASFRAENIVNDTQGISFDLMLGGKKLPLKTNLMGDYNVSNCLAAAAVCLEGLNIAPEIVQTGVKNLAGIPGRMESISMGQDYLAIVDFAHTPNALQRVITAARKFSDRRVITVFGSAGLRDQEKRRLMAQVSGELADLTVLTAEDPRTESLDNILDEMAAGVLSQGGIEEETFWCVKDRGEAIRFALSKAQTGDVVLVCGKGHEQSMCFGKTEYPWDDRTATRSALSDLVGKPGPEMPSLPTSES
jgi:UDP-N-acetylmuramoyl-L-alanyl-D-glutamate--2,6-diaminopimelate ligase